MKRFTVLAVVTSLMLTAIDSRADDTGTVAATIGKSQLKVLNK
jgi:hypothetical protein